MQKEGRMKRLEEDKSVREKTSNARTIGTDDSSKSAGASSSSSKPKRSREEKKLRRKEKKRMIKEKRRSAEKTAKTASAESHTPDDKTLSRESVPEPNSVTKTTQKAPSAETASAVKDKTGMSTSPPIAKKEAANPASKMTGGKKAPSAESVNSKNVKSTYKEAHSKMANVGDGSVKTHHKKAPFAESITRGPSSARKKSSENASTAPKDGPSDESTSKNLHDGRISLGDTSNSKKSSQTDSHSGEKQPSSAESATTTSKEKSKKDKRTQEKVSAQQTSPGQKKSPSSSKKKRSTGIDQKVPLDVSSVNLPNVSDDLLKVAFEKTKEGPPKRIQEHNFHEEPYKKLDFSCTSIIYDYPLILHESRHRLLRTQADPWRRYATLKKVHELGGFIFAEVGGVMKHIRVAKGSQPPPEPSEHFPLPKSRASFSGEAFPDGRRLPPEDAETNADEQEEVGRREDEATTEGVHGVMD
ncbi:hypothetical protein L596_009019 [Steinernema carpocapsae]|uniref:Uncharacterized protein n=1 Tax=Steinernema carpocapsae TaxID=34508 RepID=A0A4U5PEZ1_STECR|nr:hypothetical protein L596_009019 [Steinernema carpocapsae]